MNRTYRTISSPTQFTFEEKRSRFIACIWPAASKNALADRLAAARQAHPEARHICYAYVLGDPKQALAAGFNDDGEPKGTAGRPILNVLMQRQIGDAAAIVVRYFGGIKLGAGGLVRAYGQAVSGALDLAQIIDVVPKQVVRVCVDFSQEERVRHLLQQSGIQSPICEYAERVTLTCECSIAEIANLRSRLREITSGAATFVPAED